MILRSQKKKNKIIPDSLQPKKVLSVEDKWQNFLQKIQSFDDLVLVTMMQEAKFISFDKKSSIVTISFLKKFTIFKDIIEQEKKHWSIVLQNLFGHNSQLQFDFESTAQKTQQSTVQESNIKKLPVIHPHARFAGNKLDVSDASHWKLTHELMKYFDGIITEISGNMYE